MYIIAPPHITSYCVTGFLLCVSDESTWCRHKSKHRSEFTKQMSVYATGGWSADVSVYKDVQVGAWSDVIQCNCPRRLLTRWASSAQSRRLPAWAATAMVWVSLLHCRGPSKFATWHVNILHTRARCVNVYVYLNKSISSSDSQHDMSLSLCSELVATLFHIV